MPALKSEFQGYNVKMLCRSWAPCHGILSQYQIDECSLLEKEASKPTLGFARAWISLFAIRVLSFLDILSKSRFELSILRLTVILEKLTELQSFHNCSKHYEYSNNVLELTERQIRVLFWFGGPIKYIQNNCICKFPYKLTKIGIKLQA